MPIPQNKAELIKDIHENYRKLIVELDTLLPDMCNKKELEGHAKDTMMSINDLLAYLIGWGQLVLKWHHRKSKGLEVDFPETGYKWNQLGLLAQKFYRDYEKDDIIRLKSKLEQTTNDILLLIASKSDEELYHFAWYNHYTLGRMIQLNTSAPFKNAMIRVRKWKSLDVQIVIFEN